MLWVSDSSVKAALRLSEQPRIIGRIFIEIHMASHVPSERRQSDATYRRSHAPFERRLIM